MINKTNTKGHSNLLIGICFLWYGYSVIIDGNVFRVIGIMSFGDYRVIVGWILLVFGIMFILRWVTLFFEFK